VTLGGWLRRAERLYSERSAALGQSASTARDEALYLILRTLDLPLESGPAVLKRKVAGDEAIALESVFYRRLVEHVPAAYITGEAWLGGLRFYVDPRVLIPRSYFVEILPSQVDPWLRDPAGVHRVADICTGSGCLAILLARHFAKAKVDAVDISADALSVAAINIRRYRLGRRVRAIRGDLLGGSSAAYDVIVCNPPYEATSHVDHLPAEFRKEPRLALDGGKDGLDLIRRLIRQSRRRLKPGGILLIEVGGGRAGFEREFAGLHPHWFYTDDGSDCVCLIQADRLLPTQGRARS
jgi:ribosomal protein L3 glutamine methyltransferase